MSTSDASERVAMLRAQTMLSAPNSARIASSCYISYCHPLSGHGPFHRIWRHVSGVLERWMKFIVLCAILDAELPEILMLPETGHPSRSHQFQWCLVFRRTITFSRHIHKSYRGPAIFLGILLNYVIVCHLDRRPAPIHAFTIVCTPRSLESIAGVCMLDAGCTASRKHCDSANGAWCVFAGIGSFYDP